VARRLRSALTERLALKAVALFFAAALWFVVSSEEPTEELVPVRFVPTLEGGVTLAAPAPAVRALVVGSTRELLKLYVRPPAVRYIISADAPESYDIELRASDVDLPSGVRAVVRDVQPKRVTLRLAHAAASGRPRGARSATAGEVAPR
jgi:hypothetical protein